MPIVYTGGTFDGLHAGHLELLTACREMAGPDGRVVASLNTDEFVLNYKGRTVLVPYAERRELLMACRLVDMVVRNTGGPDSSVAIDVIQPDLIAIGDDWLDKDHDERRYLAQLGITPEWLAKRNLTIVYVPRTRGVSSTSRRVVMGHTSGLTKNEQRGFTDGGEGARVLGTGQG